MKHPSMVITEADYAAARGLIHNSTFRSALSVALYKRLGTSELRDLIQAFTDQSLIGPDGWGRSASGGLESYQILKAVAYQLGRPKEWDYLNLNYKFQESFILPPVEVPYFVSTPQGMAVIEKRTTQFFKKKAFLKGVNIESLTNDAIFQAIAEKEAEVKALKAIKNKPNILKKEIKDRLNELAELLIFMDGGK